jgi:hypothetical protein
MTAPTTNARPFAGAGPRAWTELASGRMVLILVAGLCALNVALSYPGLMSNDANNQYAEALSGHYSDWHPPVMAWLWSWLRYVAEGPAPLFVLHLLAYWAGLGLIADAARRAGHARIALWIVVVGVFPPFVLLNANVIKDVGMVAAWIAAVGLIYWHRSQDRRMPLAWAFVTGLLLAYGALVRSNAVFGLGPLLLYALAPASWMRNVRLMVAAVVVALVAIPLSQQVNRHLFHAAERDAVNSLFLFDLIGIAAQEKDPAIAQPRAHLTQQDLKTCYTPYWWDSFSPWGRCASRVNRPDSEHATLGEGIARQWLTTIREHPLAYAAHRLKHFNSEIYFAVPLTHQRLAPEYRGDLPDSKSFQVFTPRQVQFDLVKRNPAVWPVTWLVWGAVLLLFLAKHLPTAPVVFARVVLVSALAYSCAYLVIGVATDFRYHYWSILVTMISTLLVWPELRRGWKERSRALVGGLALLGVVVLAGLATRLLDFQAWVV